MYLFYKDELEKIYEKLIKDDYKYHDHYDIWSTRAGIILKKYRFLTPLTGILYLSDIYIPSAIRIFFRKKIPTEILPWLIHGLIFLADETAKEKYYIEIRRLYNYMIENMGRSSKGKGLGLHFDWYTDIPAYTPCVTLTSYALDIIMELHEKRIISSHNEEILSEIGDFVYKDLNFKKLSDASGRITYTELDNFHVLNANSYGARIMCQLGDYFNNKDYKERSAELLNYVISQQNEDGSWYYYDKESLPPEENFIDCFHSAYILENLYFIYKNHPTHELLDVINKGKEFFFNKFINDNYCINHFYISNLPVKISTDIRSNAEAINLLSIISDLDNNFLEYAGKILENTMKNMYDKNNNYFYFRKFRYHLSEMDYPRWGTGPMINAITNYLYALKKHKA